MNRTLTISEVTIPLYELLNAPHIRSEALAHGWVLAARVSRKRQLNKSVLEVYGSHVYLHDLFNKPLFQRFLLLAGYNAVYIGGPGSSTSTSTTSTSTLAPICDKLGVVSHNDVAAYNDFASTIGFAFTVGAKPLTVTHVGRINNPGDSHQQMVGLYLYSNMSLIIQTLVNVPSVAVGQFAFSSITPTLLSANQKYLVAATEVVGQNSWQYQCPIVGNSDITVNAASGTAAAENAGSYSYGPVNFKYCVPA